MCKARARLGRGPASKDIRAKSGRGASIALGGTGVLSRRVEPMRGTSSLPLAGAAFGRAPHDMLIVFVHGRPVPALRGVVETWTARPRSCRGMVETRKRQRMPETRQT